MRFQTQTPLLFLDFDGVLCDSLEECYRSSWLAATNYKVSAEAPPAPPFDSAYRRRFDACRPFIRSGEDYLVVHEWAARGATPASQAEFDATLDKKGAAWLATAKTRLYAVRDTLLERHRGLWLSWNPLYPGIAEALITQASNPNAWILSTKKAEFIAEILAHHGAPWPLERTLYTGTRKKLEIIDERAPGRESALIDDQVDHLDFAHPFCQCYLALWGYTAPGAGDKAGASLTLAQALEAINGFPRPHPHRAE